jgi:hypothetical protein
VSRAPGSVVVLRHSFAPGGFDPPDAKLDHCSTQRNLDERGRAQARRLGDAFRQNGVAGHRSGPALVLVTHGSVVTDLTGLSIRMGEFVVLRRAPDGSHAVAGQLYVD